MGVTACGKSTVGKALAEATGGSYLEGDDLHPPSNIDKMSRGEPLTDTDRWPWLEQVAAAMFAHEGIVFAGCSALKQSYRDVLSSAPDGFDHESICFVHLDGSHALIAERMGAREGHFMPLDLLDSQFATLERLDAGENAVVVTIDGSTDEIVTAIMAQISA